MTLSPGMQANTRCIKLHQRYIIIETGECCHACLCFALSRETLKKRSVELICQAYQQMYAAITDPKHEYKDTQAIVPRTPEQVSKLLS